MKSRSLILFVFVTLITISISSCKKDKSSVPAITFSETEGTANDKGEYLLTGMILSDIQLNEVILTKEGTVSPNLTIAGMANTYTDNSTAKNKTEYAFAYQINGIVANTYIIMDIYDQNGTKKTVRFLVKVLI